MAVVIELTALTKRYGATVGIQQLDLRVEAGEVFGFLGPNGAGKTTTIRCLVGLLSPTAGAVRVLGLDPIADHGRLTLQIGYLPGGARLGVGRRVGAGWEGDGDVVRAVVCWRRSVMVATISAS
jgi:ABC-type multidrug transport system ATPase subunit